MQQTITRHIKERTSGRIQVLQVEVRVDTILVRGVSPSFYIKQLALQAVLDVLSANDLQKLEFHVEVIGGPARDRFESPTASDASLRTPG